MRRESALAKLSMTVNWTVGFPLGRPVLPAVGRHGVRLHAIAPGNSDPQRPHGITLPAFGTESASFRKSQGGVDASPRPRAPESRLSSAACTLPEPARLAPSGTWFASAPRTVWPVSLCPLANRLESLVPTGLEQREAPLTTEQARNATLPAQLEPEAHE